MRLGFLSRTTKSSVASARIRSSTALTISLVLLFAFLQTGFVSCAKKEKQQATTPTSGSVVVFASPAVVPVIQSGADQFNRLYPKANVNVYSLNSRAIVDSLIYRRIDVGYFDRPLSQAESLAVIRTRKQLYSFILGSTIATWIDQYLSPPIR
jgi:ABC-type phosphate transport system substrate-binding protein